MPATRRRFVLVALLAVPLASTAGCRTPGDPPSGAPPAAGAPAAARTVDGLIRALYASVSFERGGPDWPAFRQLVLPESVYLSAPRPGAPMRVMDLAAFERDFEAFARSGRVAEVGFQENLQRIDSTEFGAIAHAFTVFAPTVGDRPNTRRGVDSIQLIRRDGRWWVASITTQFEGPGLAIPPRIRGAGAD